MCKFCKQSPYLTAREAAKFLRLTVRTLENKRWDGNGPAFHRHGRIFYHIDDLKEWSAMRRYNSTSEKSKKKPNNKPDEEPKEE